MFYDSWKLATNLNGMKKAGWNFKLLKHFTMCDRNLSALSRELIAVKSRQRNNSSSNRLRNFPSVPHSTSCVWLSKTSKDISYPLNSLSPHLKFSVLRKILISNQNHKINDERNSGTIDFRDKLSIETELRGRSWGWCTGCWRCVKTNERPRSYRKKMFNLDCDDSLETSMSKTKWKQNFHI